MSTMKVESKTTPLRRVAMASCAGTTIEYYDFFVYGIAAALVFPKVFFPALGPTAGTVASFATFGVAFIARPLGGVVFGHYGDRVGRKRTLVSTLLIMGVATLLIGLLPSANTIGAAAPIILVVLRFAQGFAFGGEWAGAVLLTAEYAPKTQRGWYGVFPQVGSAIAYALSSGAFLLTGFVLGDTDDTFLAYGWRIPFIASVLLVAVGLYVRLRIDETPAFTAVERSSSNTRRGRLPFTEALRQQPRETLLAAGALVMLFAFFYIGTAYLTSYAISPTGVGLSRQTVLTVGIGAAVLFGLVIVVSGRLSDRFGRRRVIMTSCVLAVAWGFTVFPLLDTGSPVAFAIGLGITMTIFAMSHGPAGSFLPELFAARYRYTGAAISYNLASIVGGAIPPLVAPGLLENFGSMAVGAMLSLTGLISLVCTFLLSETCGVALEHDR